jgi:uncharacterized protein (TIGR02246 family)
MSSEEQDIRDAHAVWISAVNSGDVDLLLTLMTDDAVFLGPGQQPFGPNGFRTNFAAAKEQFVFTCASEIEEASVVGDIAYVRSRDDLRIAPRTGGPEVKLTGHRLTIYQRGKDGHWLLARDAHTLSNVAA